MSEFFDLTLQYDDFTSSKVPVTFTQYPDKTWSAQIKPSMLENVLSVRLQTNTQDLIKLGMVKSVLDYSLFDSVKKSLYLMYVPGARDDVQHVGRSFGLRVYADALNTQKWDSVTTLDPHSPVTPVAINNYCYNDDYLKFFTSVFSYYSENNKVVVLTPDAGATKRYRNVLDIATRHGFETMEATKYRDPKTGLLGAPKLYVENPLTLKDATVIIVDDICSRGGTFKALTAQLHHYEVLGNILAVPHYEYTADVQSMRDAGIVKVHATNSIVNNSGSNTGDYVNIFNI